MLLAKLFDPVARPVAVAVHRADYQIRPLDPGFQVLLSIVHIAVMVVEFSAAGFNQIPIQVLELGYAADNKNPLCAKLKLRTLVTAILVGVLDKKRNPGNQAVDLFGKDLVF